MFDIIRFLDEYKIPYKTKGANIGDGWIGINCLFCDDPSTHLCFNLRNGNFRCWRCGGKKWEQLITEITDENVETILRDFRISDKLYIPPQQEKNKEIEVEFNFKKQLTNWDKGYLKERGFNYKKLQEEWDIRSGDIIGDYRFRIMIPVYSRGKVVSFQGRDTTNHQKEKYRSAKGTPLKNYLYGYDNIDHEKGCFVVEGIFDVWRLGKGNAVATFGIQHTLHQRELLRKIKHIRVLFDSDTKAQVMAESLVRSLSSFTDIQNIKLPDGVKDPDGLSITQRNKIKKLLFF